MHKEATSTQQACWKTTARESSTLLFEKGGRFLASSLLLTGPSSTCIDPDMTPEDRDWNPWEHHSREVLDNLGIGVDEDYVSKATNSFNKVTLLK